MTEQNIAITAQPRERIGKKARHVRRQGKVPAVVYGYRVAATSIELDAREFEHMYRTAGKTSLVELSIEGGPTVPVLVQEVQVHPLTRRAQHVDFHAVNLSVEIAADIPLVLVGTSPAAESNLGIIVRGVETVTVHARPADLPHQIEVPIDALTEVDQAIHVSDLPAGAAYTITSSPEDLVVKLVAPAVEPEPEVEAAEDVAASDGEQDAGAAATDEPTDTGDAAQQ